MVAEIEKDERVNDYSTELGGQDPKVMEEEALLFIMSVSFLYQLSTSVRR